MIGRRQKEVKKLAINYKSMEALSINITSTIAKRRSRKWRL